MNDVARLAGVSSQTVSRAVNSPNLLSPATLAKVRRAIDLLDYHPNVAAQSLANRTVKMIGLFMPFTQEQVKSNMFFHSLSATVCQRCAQHDFVLQLFTANPDESYVRLFKRLYREKRVGGLLLTCPSMNTKEIGELRSSAVPFVLIGRPAAPDLDVDYVDVDNAAGAHMAAQHLLNKGHRDIALLNAPKFMTLSEDLRSGVQRACQEQGEPVRFTEIHSELTYKSGLEIMRRLIASDSRPTGIITADDLLALTVKRAADEARLRIPEDIAVISTFASGWYDVMEPELTHVDTGFERIGIVAAEHMMKVILKKNPPPLRTVLDVKLTEGKST